MPRDGATVSETIELDASELVQAASFFRHLKVFKAELAELARMDVPTEQHRRAYAHELMVELLQRDPELMVSGNLKPLFDILIALHDDVETKPKITFTHYAQGMGVVAYAALVNPDAVRNPRRDGMKPAKARNLLNEMLRDRKLDVRGITLQSWHYHVAAGTAAPAMIEAFQSWEPVLAKLRNATEAKACAAEWLDVVASLKLPSLKLWHPSPAT